MTVKVDMKVGEDLLADFEYLERNILRVGMVSNPHLTAKGDSSDAKQKDDKGNPGPLTVGEVLYIHEQGLGVPKRTPVKSTFDEKPDEINESVAAHTSAMIDRKQDGEATVAKVGEEIVIMMKETLIAHVPPPLSEARKKQKRRSGLPADTPLIYRSQLINSFRYEIKPTTGI